jgi:hypothetical protein
MVSFPYLNILAVLVADISGKQVEGKKHHNELFSSSPSCLLVGLRFADCTVLQEAPPDKVLEDTYSNQVGRRR